MADTQESFPNATTGINTTVGVQVTGSGVTVGTSQFQFDLTMTFGETAMVTAQAVDLAGTPQSATVTAVSANGAPSQTGESSEFTAYPIGGGGAQYANIPNIYNGPADVPGIGANSNVSSVTGTVPFILSANDTGEAEIRFTAAGGRIGILHVVVQNPTV